MLFQFPLMFPVATLYQFIEPVEATAPKAVPASQRAADDVEVIVSYNRRIMAVRVGLVQPFAIASSCRRGKD
jgi:hypothetical protein